MTADIDEIHRRLTLAVKERCDYLKSTVDNYLASELKNLKELHANLELEVTNIQVRRRHSLAMRKTEIPRGRIKRDR